MAKQAQLIEKMYVGEITLRAVDAETRERRDYTAADHGALVLVPEQFAATHPFLFKDVPKPIRGTAELREPIPQADLLEERRRRRAEQQAKMEARIKAAGGDPKVDAEDREPTKSVESNPAKAEAAALPDLSEMNKADMLNELGDTEVDGQSGKDAFRAEGGSLRSATEDELRDFLSGWRERATS